MIPHDEVDIQVDRGRNRLASPDRFRLVVDLLAVDAVIADVHTT